METFFAGLARRDLAAVLDAFVPDERAALYGSERGEVAVGQEALRDFFAAICAKPVPFEFSFAHPRVALEGKIAWMVAEAEVRAGAERIAPYRITMVLVQTGSRWKIALFDGSEPLPPRA